MVIAHNNVESLSRCLESLNWADEIIVVDRGSTDGSLDIARRFTEHIYFHPSESTQILRNFAFSQCQSDWIVLLEPTEWIEEMLRHEIDGVLLSPHDYIHGFTIPTHFYFRGTHIKPGGNYPRRGLRLFRREHAISLSDAYFNAIAVPNHVKSLEHAIGCEPYKTLMDVFRGANERSTNAAYHLIESRGTTGRAFASSCLNMILAPNWVFLTQYIFAGRIFGGFYGLIFSAVRAYETFLKYAKYRTIIDTPSKAS